MKTVGPGVPEYSSNDVECAYFVFLGRAPEHAHANTWSSASDLAQHFINSEEFDLGVAKPILEGGILASDRYIGEPTPELRRWMGSFLPITARSRRKLAEAKQWRAALRLIFSDAAFGKAITVEGRGWSLRTLAAALKKPANIVLEKPTSPSRRNGILYGLTAWWTNQNETKDYSAGASDPYIVELQATHDHDGASLSRAVETAEFVRLVAKSPMFDPDYYASVAKFDADEYELAKHYLLVGEAEGLRPSSHWDPSSYNDRNPDVRTECFNTLLHYELAGRSEGRSFQQLLSNQLEMGIEGIDPSKSTILLLCHQASRTGAPILGWNLTTELSTYHNVVVVFLEGGELTQAFEGGAAAVGGPVQEICSDSVDLMIFASRMVATYRPLYVIGNSVESGPIAIALRERGCALVLLVHEFSSHSISSGALRRLYGLADHIVFPAPIVAQSSIDDYDQLRLQNVHILPQGRSRVPPSNTVRCDDIEIAGSIATGVKNLATANTEMFRTLSEGTQDSSQLKNTAQGFLVIGLGAVDLRKGVDLFLATGTCLKRIAPDLNIRFVWVGHDFNPGGQFRTLLDEQVERSGLGEAFTMLDVVEDLEPIYNAADALLLSSRLDPLPNVAIDAVIRGLPVVCFQNATGIAEFLMSDAHTAHLAVPYLDIGAAAEALAGMARDEPERGRLGSQLASRARDVFDMPRYAARLNELGLAAAEHAATAREGVDLLTQEGNFEGALFAGKDAHGASKESLIHRYLEESRRWAFSRGPVWGLHPRRPLPGFHPMAYAAEHPRFPQDSSANPLVHFLKEGRPEGGWYHQSIKIENQQKAKSALSAVIHGHFHYTDNFVEFLQTLEVNQSRFDLILTTTSKDAEQFLKRKSIKYKKGSVRIRVGANVGRDVGPFLQLLSEGAFDEYDAVGHIHGKRSLHTMSYDPELGNRWRLFLWDHLLGPSAPSADIILQAMEKDPTLGLVFPENPEVIGWEKNFAQGEALAKRMGLKMPLSPHVDFPVGTMFWARPGALIPFTKAELTEIEFPGEPLPIDGTILHAIERLLTPAAVEAGYNYASVYDPRRVRTG